MAGRGRHRRAGADRGRVQLVVVQVHENAHAVLHGRDADLREQRVQHGLTERHDALLSSRTVRPHPVVAFFLLNENYHLEHHLYPEVPSYHLPALHRAAWDHLPRTCEDTSYLGFLVRFVQQSWALDETPVGVVHREVPASRLGGAEPA